MIFKKPYAFLIKNFKLINILLTLLTSYIMYKTYYIVKFFNDFIKNNYVGNFYPGFFKEYISSFLFFTLILTIIGIFLILLLFIYKKKPLKIYAISIIYYILLYIVLTFVKNTMISMETTVITVEYSRIIRDITIISIIPQLGLIIAFFLRGVGVNFNKFGFEDDLKDLEISNEDNEEVEITFNNDGTKFKRTLRRFRREFKYYVKENKIIFIIGTIILIFVIGFISYKNFPTNFDKSYNEGEILSINGVSYTLENSMLTNIDYNGNIVDKDNYFLVIKLKIDNNNGNDYEFDYHNFKLELNNNSLYPELGYNRKFVDYVTTYKTNIIKGNSSGYFPLIYKISTDTLNSKYKIKISNGQVNTDSGKIYVNVNPIIIDEFSIEKTVNLDDELIFTNSNLNNTTLKLSNLIITNKYVYDYEFCLNNVCSTLKDQVSTGFNSLSTLLIFDYEYNIVEDVPFYSYSATFGGFIENFARIKYLKNNEMIYGSITNKTPDKLNNKIVLEVTNNAINSNEVYLSFLIRNKEYLIKIK